MDKIDIVIPWVDDQDSVWIKDRNKYLDSFEDKKSTINKFFRDWGTLVYVFRGIEKFMPWVNKVHLLTYGHIPEWLNVNANKLNIVKHKDFFLSPSNLPIFNANAIEVNLLGIKNLSDKFVYFNDDTLVLKDTPIERFFKNGKPLDFIIQEIPRRGILYRKLISNDTYVDLPINDVKLINEKFSKKILLKKHPELFYNECYNWKSKLQNYIFNIFPHYYYFRNYHFQQPYLRSNIEETYSLFKREMDLTSKNRFRTRHDVNQYLYRYVRLAKGEFEPYEPNDTYCMVLSSYKTFLKNKHRINEVRFFCPNDSPYISEEDYIRTKKELTAILNNILPEKCSFEK